MPAALAARKPKAGHWVGKATKPGETLNGRNGDATFTVSRERPHPDHASSKSPASTAFCFTGYQVIASPCRDAPIKHGVVNTTYKIPNVTNAKVKLNKRPLARRTCQR